MRLFAGDRIYRILDNKSSARSDEDGKEQPIEPKMLSKQIEGAQKKVEEQNFLIRKRVLEYDDVMNQQREIIYEYRDRILEGEDMSEIARDADRRRDRAARARVHRRATTRRTGTSTRCSPSSSRSTRLSYRARGHRARARTARRWSRSCARTSVDAYDEREEELGDELMRALERFMLLQIIDERWREHLHDMDYLREGIHLRGFAQIDPLVAYKNEGFEMFTELMNNIWDEFARYIFNVEVEVEEPAAGDGSARPALGRRRQQLEHAAAQLLGRPRGGRQRRDRRRGRRSARRRAWPTADDGRRGRSIPLAGRDARASTSTRRSAATTRAGAAPARSSRSAMAPSDASGLRDQLKLLADSS